jgi:hypothetical protein
MSIVLGGKYRDRITGFTGIVTGTAEYISGCNQALVSPPAEGGKLGDASWFDQQRLERIDDSLVTLDNGDTPGCDLAPPIR